MALRRARDPRHARRGAVLITSGIFCFIADSIFFLRFWQVFNEHRANHARVLEFNRCWQFPGHEFQDDLSEAALNPATPEARGSLVADNYGDEDGDPTDYDFRLYANMENKEDLTGKLNAWALLRQRLQLDTCDERVSLELHVTVLLFLYACSVLKSTVNIALAIKWSFPLKSGSLQAITHMPGIYVGIWDSFFIVPALIMAVVLSKRLNDCFDLHPKNIDLLDKFLTTHWYNPKFHVGKDGALRELPKATLDLGFDGELLARKDAIKSTGQIITDMNQGQMLFGIKIDKAMLVRLNTLVVSFAGSNALVMLKSVMDTTS